MSEEERKKKDQIKRRTRGGVIIGLIFISLGVILLIANLFPSLGFARLWPVVIIAWGLATFVSSLIPPFDVSRLFNGVFIGTVGVILLYNTLEIIPFDFWLNLIALWPVLLIAAGFAVLGAVNRSSIVSAFAPILIIATLILAVIYGDVIFKDRGLTDFGFSREAGMGVESGSATVDFAVGNLNVGATDMLYDIAAKEPIAREPQFSYTRSDSSIALQARPLANARSYLGNQEREWTVLLSRDIDWRLNVRTGVSNSKLDLSDLQVSDLRLEGGIGDTMVRFGDKAEQASATIHTGISRLKLIVPRSVGVRLEINRGLSTSDFQNIDLQRVGGDGAAVYQTLGFNQTEKRLDLNVDMGISSFVVEGY